MSRPILDVTLRLASGKVLTGRGRNLTATIERIYNHGSQPVSRKHATITDRMKTGHVGKGEHRYEGTFQITLSGSEPDAKKETATAEVKKSGPAVEAT